MVSIAQSQKWLVAIQIAERRVACHLRAQPNLLNLTLPKNLQMYLIMVSWHKKVHNGRVWAPIPGGRSPSFETQRGVRMLV